MRCEKRRSIPKKNLIFTLTEDDAELVLNKFEEMGDVLGT
jgi:hypothetical protein